MKLKFTVFSFALCLFFAVGAFAQKQGKIQSVYTNLDEKNCKTLESSTEGTGWYRGECKGIGGYKLHVTEGDIRQSIDVIAPNKNKYELDFIGHVSGGFSSVGAKAEWRGTSAEAVRFDRPLQRQRKPGRFEHHHFLLGRFQNHADPNLHYRHR